VIIDAGMTPGVHTLASASIEEWALAYVGSTSLTHKIAPPPPPASFDNKLDEMRVQPGRPLELSLDERRLRNLTAAALRDPKKRAFLIHTFWHHELQAAELMCWAILAFPKTPEAFRRGLLRIALDEIRHMSMYARHLESLGSHVGAFPVNDWFWTRIPLAETPSAFVSAMNIGFEGGNLDHGLRFAERFEQAGDSEAARIQAAIVEEEIPHVAFGMRWLERFCGEATFDTWRANIAAPLSPMLMRAKTLNRGARARAGQSEAFVNALEHW
jgi:uncharacterized ferritin-like protein (DUF455 family)